jgi:peptidoglycan/LPS O-acetylase OafA/YrhL
VIERVALIYMVLFFTATLLFPRIQSTLACRVLIFFGYVSYPLYLVYNNMLVGLTNDLSNVSPWMPPLMLPILPMAAVTWVAFAIAKYIEPRLRSMRTCDSLL